MYQFSRRKSCPLIFRIQDGNAPATGHLLRARCVSNPARRFRRTSSAVVHERVIPAQRGVQASLILVA